jgi:hypothetical protein
VRFFDLRHLNTTPILGMAGAGDMDGLEDDFSLLLSLPTRVYDLGIRTRVGFSQHRRTPLGLSPAPGWQEILRTRKRHPSDIPFRMVKQQTPRASTNVVKTMMKKKMMMMMSRRW